MKERDLKKLEELYADLTAAQGEGYRPQREMAKVLAAIGVEPEWTAEIHSMESAEELLDDWGVIHRRVQLEEDWWRRDLGNFLGKTVDGEIVALLIGTYEGYVFTDPKTGKRVPVTKHTAMQLAKDAIGIYRSLPSGPIGVRELLQFILRDVSAAEVISLLGAALLVTVLGLFLPFANRMIFDTIIPLGVPRDVVWVGVILISAIFIEALFRIFQGRVLARRRDKVAVDLQYALTFRVFSLPVSFFRNYPDGEIAGLLLRLADFVDVLFQLAVSGTLAFVFSLFYVRQMAQMGPFLVSPALVGAAALLGCGILAGVLWRRTMERQTKANIALQDKTYAMIRGMKKIKISGARVRAFSQWLQTYGKLAERTYQIPLFLKLVEPLKQWILIGTTIWLYGRMAHSTVSVSSFIAFQVVFLMWMEIVRQFSGIVTELFRLEPQVRTLSPLLRAEPEQYTEKSKLKEIRCPIEFVDVHFAYDDFTVLNRFNLSIRPGEYIGITGPSGCGKSTLLRLLLGFEMPSRGRIYIDGRSMDNISLRSFRQKMGTCLQNDRLFEGTIFSNLMVTHPGASMEELETALRMADIYEDVMAMPLGLSTIVSEDSTLLSGGQIQRLLVARALIGNPGLLILDESTSALDNVSQGRIVHVLEQLSCTRIVVAHRLSTLRKCDRIVVLDEGMVAEEGTYETLMRKRGRFWTLAKEQEA